MGSDNSSTPDGRHEDGVHAPCFGRKLAGIVYIDRPGAYAFIVEQTKGAPEISLIRTSHGLFLPGGGLEGLEDELTALKRELFEEAQFILKTARLVTRAAQYHWSSFYQSHFRKLGGFFEVKAERAGEALTALGHELVSLPLEQAAQELSQEFQRWAVAEFLKSRCR